MRLALILLALITTAPAQWTLQQSHTTASLRGIHALGNGIAWASGTAGTVLRTTDDGTTWQTCTTPPEAENLDFRGIQAFDASTAIVMSSGKGDLSRLYKTTDACKSWTLLITNPDKDGFWDAIKFISRDHGVVLGDPINGMFIFMVTFDGGAKWEHRPLQGRINGEAAFAASNSSLLITDKCRMFGAGGFGGPWVIGQVPMDIYKDALDALRDEISKTKNPPQDTCQITQVLPKKSHSETSGVFSLAASSDSSDSTIVAVGGDFNRPDDRDGTAWTNAHDDSTENKFEFKAVQTPPHGYRSSVAYDPTTKTWITVGPNGTDISTDHGKNWRPLKPNATDAPDADQNWNALSLPFVVGPKGRIGKLNPTALKP